MTEAALKQIARQDPIETMSTATTCIKGYSRCTFCKAEGLFSVYSGREWDHRPNCPWVEATRLLRAKEQENNGNGMAS